MQMQRLHTHVKLPSLKEAATYEARVEAQKAELAGLKRDLEYARGVIESRDAAILKVGARAHPRE